MQRLYHYTSIDSLKAILESKKIRFNNLTLMDDYEEQKSAEFADAGRWIFISSWTPLRDDKNMFKVYANNGKGICLSLPRYPFIINYGDYVSNNLQYKNSNILIEPFRYTHGIEKYNTDYNLTFFPPEVEEIVVKYSDDPELLYPYLYQENEYGERRYFDGNLGTTKNLEWAYQKEIRYRLRSTVINLMNVSNQAQFNNLMNEIMNTKICKQAPVSYIDIPINLNSIEIIIGSNMEKTTSEKTIKMIKQLCSEACISYSSIVW